ncbi:MAG: CHAD domain-containing protein [Acidobacteriia bacterium]|nr:CHAD domain-containing protein [Terriglobia bacterium]
MIASVKDMPDEGLGIKTHINGAGGNGEAVTPPLDSALPRQMTDSGVLDHSRGWNELLRLGDRYMQKFIGLLPIVLEDKDPGAAHKIRVASRRLEQILSLIYSKPLPAYARKLRRGAKRSRHLLGDLADCDVLLSMAERSLAHDPPRDVAAWKAVAHFLQQRRAKTSGPVLQKLRQVDFATPCARFQRDLEDNGVRLRVHCNGKIQALTPGKAEQIVQQRILHSLAHLWREFESIVEESHEDPCEKVIHGVRIATKRLRNLVEVMKKLGISGSAETLVLLRELQRAIGEWHDMEVLEHVTSKMLVHKKFVRDHLELAVEIEQLFLRNREIKRTSEEKFRRVTMNSHDYQEIKRWVLSKLPSRAQPGRPPLIAPHPASPPSVPDPVIVSFAASSK